MIPGVNVFHKLKQLHYFEVKHPDRFKLVTWLVKTNQSALFQHCITNLHQTKFMTSTPHVPFWDHLAIQPPLKASIRLCERIGCPTFGLIQFIFAELWLLLWNFYWRYLLLTYCKHQKQGADVINKFLSSVAMVCWNKALWLAVSSPMTIFYQSECFNSFLLQFW